MLTYYRSLLQSLFAMLLIGILVVEVLMWQIDVSARSQSAQQLLSRGADVRSVLETRLRDGIYLTRGLVSFLHSQQGLRDQKNVEDWLASMLEEVDYLINIGIAPNNRIELIYPREGNEAALGLAYSDVPAQWSAVQEIMRTGKPVLAGPLNLVQGGSGLVYRSPVYLDGRYWGLVSTVMDASALLGILDTEPRWQDLNVQLQRGQDRRAETFTRIWGADLIPGLPQQAMLIELPSVTWRLIVQPRSEQTHGVLYRVGLYVLLLLILLAVGYTSAAHIRQRREREMLRAESEKMKSEFISTINHELRTPLTSILGTLSLLQGGVVGALSKDAERMVLLAKRNGEHLLKLINDLLDIDKLVAGSMQLELQDLELDQILPRAVQELDGVVRQRDLSIEYENPFSDARVRVDPTRFKQVLDNLLSNAIKFSPPGAVIHVQVRSVEDGARWRIEVRDHGGGMPLGFQDKVFERFTQADSSSQRRAGGTGLGLAITRGLVEQMGGEIGFTSSDAGTCFYVLMPALTDAAGIETPA
tara:strand:- start:1704 stop:3293 length:1590 start_codon:yes stop_codon:yes gene_type:complete